MGSELRGLDTIIEALPMIRAEVPEVKVRFAGKSYFGTKNNLEDLAESLGVEEHVEFTGWIDPEEFPKYMKAADIGLVPYRSIPVTNTTVPNKLFQYMAAELPVLVTDTDAVGRIVRETNSGVVVPAEDPDAFAEGAIELADPDRRAELGRNGRKAVEEEYNWERDAERLLKVYESL
ncbi:MAG: glycosyltransferase [Halobacteriales archaeon]|nr:glycosyltransferase [Halobacteriales archaeon]